MELWQIIIFSLWMGIYLLISAIGFTRLGNPHFLGRYLAHRSVGHKHILRKRK